MHRCRWGKEMGESPIVQTRLAVVQKVLRVQLRVEVGLKAELAMKYLSGRGGFA